MSGADIVKVVVFEVVALDFAVLVDHSVGVELAIVLDVVAAVFEIGVEH